MKKQHVFHLYCFSLPFFGLYIQFSGLLRVNRKLIPLFLTVSYSLLPGLSPHHLFSRWCNCVVSPYLSVEDSVFTIEVKCASALPVYLSTTYAPQGFDRISDKKSLLSVCSKELCTVCSFKWRCTHTGQHFHVSFTVCCTHIWLKSSPFVLWGFLFCFFLYVRCALSKWWTEHSASF